MTIFVVGLASSLGAGALQQSIGWQAMNMLLLPWLGIAALSIVWLAQRRRASAAA